MGCTLNGLEIKVAYTRFLSVYQKLWKEYVPLKRKSNDKKRNEWMSKETLNLVRRKHKLWYKIRSDIDKTEYRRKCVDLTRSIRNDKMKWETKLASRAKHDPKLIYSYIRKKMDVKEQIRVLKDDEGELTVDKLEIADILNRHFESVFIKEPPG